MELFENLKNSILQFTFKDILDVLLVAIVIYGVLRVTSKTRASSVLKGLGVIIVVAQICSVTGLSAMSWLLNSFISMGFIFVVILFQPELRRALEKIGRGKLFDISFSSENIDSALVVDEIQRAVLNMSIHKVGALLVFERKTGLRDVIESGTQLNAEISSEILESLFFPNSPLHDGAVIVRNSKIIAAGCFLPLSDNKQLPSELGTRHRAAIGISEYSDCIVLIVSEETGIISMAKEGAITRYLDRKALRELLETLYLEKERAPHILKRKIRNKGEKQ